MWDSETGELIRIFEPLQGWINLSLGDSLYWHADGEKFTYIGGSYKVTWDIQTGKIIEVLTGDQYGIYSFNVIAINPSRTLVARGSHSPTDSNIRIWDINENRQIANLQDHLGGVSDIVFSPNGDYLLYGTGGADIRLLDINRMTEIYNLNFPNRSIVSLAFSPDGKIILIRLWEKTEMGGMVYSFKLLDTATGEVLLTISDVFRGSNGWWTNPVFSPDGNNIAASVDNYLRIWDIATGNYIEIHPE
jgi:WD40 repeat protein